MTLRSTVVIMSKMSFNYRQLLGNTPFQFTVSLAQSDTGIIE